MNKVRFFLEEIFRESSLNMRYFNRVFLGLSEAVNNSIVHGNCLDKEKHVFIKIAFAENQLSIIVKDQGDGFSFDCICDPTAIENLRKENGRGIFLLRQIADEVDYFDGGSKVLIKYSLA